MSSQVCEAIFENGVFRPVSPISGELTEGQRVRLVVSSAADDILSLAAAVYDGLPAEEVDEIERIALNRRNMFDRSGL